MPAAAAASAREILTGPHSILAARGSVQSRRGRVADLIAVEMRREGRSICLPGETWICQAATNMPVAGASPAVPAELAPGHKTVRDAVRS